MAGLILMPNACRLKVIPYTRFRTEFSRSLSSKAESGLTLLLKDTSTAKCFSNKKYSYTQVVSLFRSPKILLPYNAHKCAFEIRQFSTEPSQTDQKQSKEAEFSATAMEQERAEHYKQTWRKLKMSAYGFGGFFLVITCGFVYLYGSKKYDDLGNEVKDQFTEMPFLKQLFSRAWFEFWLFVRSVPEPSRDKLLPDPLREPYYQPKYTVVFELSGVLVHPDWTFNTGWRFKKRPGIDYFLKALGYPRTEMVVYTNEQGMTAQPIVESLDTDNQIMYKLYRDTTKYQYKDGAHIKDLSKLNRDLSKVIFIDWDTKAFQLNPENALRVPKWTGDDEDLGLIDLANLIRTIVESDVQDVRPVLQYYSSHDDPLHEFRENQKKLLEIEQSKTKNLYHDDSLTKNWAGKLFGFKRHS